MDKSGNPIPKIRHTNIKNDQRKMRAIMSSFVKEMEGLSEKKFRDKWKGWDDANPDNLLAKRKELVKLTKEGMLERKDLEVAIALQAVVVWFLRLEKAKQDRIIGMW